MALWWISSGEVVGPAILGIGVPDNFEEVEGPEARDRDLLYVDGQTIKLKPERPSPSHVWSVTQKTWIEQSLPAPGLAIDWTGFLAALRNTPVFARIYSASTQSLRANSAYTLLTSTLTTTHNLDDFQWAIAELREGMTTSTGDFSNEEIEWINQKLDLFGFDFEV